MFGTVTVTTLAGGGPDNWSDGTGAAAGFNNPYGIATDGTNLYVADTDNHTVRQIVIASGVVTTLAGTAHLPDSTDGTGAAARFNHPAGIATDGTNLYVADTDNHTVRQIVIATRAVTTLAGTPLTSGATDGIGAAARFNSPHGAATDGTSLYVTDKDNHTVRQIAIASGDVTTLAGTALMSGATNGIGAEARFNSPYGITRDGANLYVTDTFNEKVRKIVIATGAVTNLAGTAGAVGTPVGIITDGVSLYVTDTFHNKVYQIQ